MSGTGVVIYCVLLLLFGVRIHEWGRHGRASYDESLHINEDWLMHSNPGELVVVVVSVEKQLQIGRVRLLVCIPVKNPINVIYGGFI
jgi:hypothetical protein